MDQVGAGWTDSEKLLLQAAIAATGAPERYTPRDGDEPLYWWQARAVLASLRAMPVGQRMEAMGMQPDEGHSYYVTEGRYSVPKKRPCWTEATDG